MRRMILTLKPLAAGRVLSRQSAFALRVAFVAALLVPSPFAARAQAAPSPSQSAAVQQTPDQPPDQTDQGGPNIDNGTIILPKKKESEEPPPPPAPEEPKVRNPNGQTYSIQVNVPEVHLDVSVIQDRNHQFIPGLKASNFLVLEDGVEQRVDTVRITQTPITAVMLLEFAANNWYVINDMENAAVSFFRSLRPDDYIALMTYDLQTHILADFTSNKQVIAEAMQSLTFPSFSDTNTFDALYETLDRLSRVDGRKYVILIGTGRDTFSKITLDKILAKIKATPNVTIFTIGTGALLNEAGSGGGMRELNYLQAQNQLKTFASMTGGMSFSPLFQGEMADDFAAINNSIRNKYVLTYRPTNAASDGTYRRIQVVLVDNEGHPLQMADEKGKPLKYSVITRDGYNARRPVE